jgi:tetratricopeptide (TPR) repeat protein
MKAANSRIAALDLAGAEAELGNLLSGFAGHEKLGEVVHEVVEEYRDAGLYEESRGLFAYLLENWDETPDTMLELQVGVALQSIKLNELDKADAAVAKLIADYNDHPRIGKALFQIGEQYFYASNHLKTIQLLQLIETSYPQQEFPARNEVPFVLATCYKRVHELDKAIEYYAKTIERYPDSRYAAWCPYNLGWIYNQVKDDYEKAIYWYQQQRRLYPDSNYASWALFDVQCIYIYMLEDYAKGAETCREYLDQYPNGLDSWGSLSNLALCREKLGDKAKAIEALLEAHEKAKNDGLRNEVLERIHRLQGEIQ